MAVVVCGDLDEYGRARAAGFGHVELVEITNAGVNLFWYRPARRSGVANGAIVAAVTVHGLSAGLLGEFADRMVAAPGADVSTIVFELVADVREAQ